MRLVEQCKNWHEISIVQGHHCWNCAYRDGYPYRAQPDKQCKNYAPISKVKAQKIRLLQTTLGNDVGDIVKVEYIDGQNIYYNDGLKRYCWFSIDDRDKFWEWVNP
jgi:hypothetical protein